MNNIFNIKRLGLVARKDLMENGKRYLLLFLTMLGIMTIVLTVQSWDHYSSIEKKISYPSNLNYMLFTSLTVLFCICGMLFASTFMSPMNSKIKRISYLVCPSSNLEKFFSRWSIITVGYIIAFFTALWVADMLRVGICSARFSDMEVHFLDLKKLVYFGDDWDIRQKYFIEERVFIIGVSLYFLFQSLFVLGATFWEKATFVKTFIAGAAVVLAYVLLCRQAILLAYGSFNNFGNMLQSFELPEKSETTQEQAIALIACVIVLFALINWTLAYFRLRESEITKRL